MKALVLGSGGREHAIAYSLSKSSMVEKVFVAPGNGGTAEEFENVDINVTFPFLDIIQFVQREKVDLVAVGPETYLVEGIVDTLTDAGILAFGPNKKAAVLEGSKQFAKSIMVENNISTASYHVFTDLESASNHIKTQQPPYVLKADGLAAGKGVIIAQEEGKALESLKEYFVGKTFGAAGETLVIESFLKGEEVSILAFTDGEAVKILPPSQDHKRLSNAENAPNTGGMGVYTPVKILSQSQLKHIEDKILMPTIRGLAKRGINYRGILYAGLIIDGDAINVLEFNCRFGDPEAQCVLPLLKSDLSKVMLACIKGNLVNVDFELSHDAACTVVMASGGYPYSYQNGFEIKGLDTVKKAKIFHAGTVIENGKTMTHGGRVLAITAFADTLPKAINTVYREIKQISFKNCFYRQDIGQKGL